LLNAVRATAAVLGLIVKNIVFKYFLTATWIKNKDVPGLSICTSHGGSLNLILFKNISEYILGFESGRQALTCTCI
jgi:hypothetical protein